MTPFYGTINPYPPSTSENRRIAKVRTMGGSFQHLKELLRAERARELQVNTPSSFQIKPLLDLPTCLYIVFGVFARLVGPPVALSSRVRDKISIPLPPNLARLIVGQKNDSETTPGNSRLSLLVFFSL